MKKMMSILPFILYLAAIESTSDKKFTTKKWMRRNKHIFDTMVYSESEIMSLKDTNVQRGKVISFTTKWKKPSTERFCGATWQKKWWQKLIRGKRSSECTKCCTTDLCLVVPLEIDYAGTKYDVYHPTDGFQIMFQGVCSSGAECSSGSGTCTEEEDYHTWILIEDLSLRYDPKIKFVPVSYPRYCKCT